MEVCSPSSASSASSRVRARSGLTPWGMATGSTWVSGTPDLAHAIVNVICVPLRFTATAGGNAQIDRVRHPVLGPRNDSRGCHASRAAVVTLARVFGEGVQQLVDRQSIHRDQFIEAGHGQAGARDRVDQYFAVVDVDCEAQIGAEVRGQLIAVMAILKACHIFIHDLEEIEVAGGGAHAVYPGRDGERIEAEKRLLPFVRSVMLGIDR